VRRCEAEIDAVVRRERVKRMKELEDSLHRTFVSTLASTEPSKQKAFKNMKKVM
jgi:hypothetical protein